MKFDKQNLIKNRFWLLLCSFGLFWFIGFAVVAFSSALGSEKTDYDNADKDLGGNNANPKHVATYVPRWVEHTKAYKAHKEKAWELAWEPQKKLLTWPTEELRVRWEKGAGKDLKGWVQAQMDDMANLNNDMGKYRAEYKNQFKKLDESVFPAEFDGGKPGFEQMMAPVGGSGTAGGGGGPRPEGGKGGKGGGGAPQGGGGGDRDILTLWNGAKDNLPPTLEEAWIAQEDFCVKRELLKAIATTIKNAARLDPGPAGFWQGVAYDNTPPADTVKRYRCHNSTWELDLIFVKKSSEDGRLVLSNLSRIKNVDVERRTLNISALPDTKSNPNGMLRFRVVYQSDRKEPQPLEIQDESQPWGKSIPIDLSPRSGAPALGETVFTPDDIKEIDQVLDWETSPVRIIEDLRVPALSQRMSNVALKQGLGFVKEEKKDANAQPAATGGDNTPTTAPAGGAGAGAGAGASQQGPKGAAQGPEGRGPRGGGGSDVSATEINRLDRARYLHVTEQSRHLPFGVALIVEKHQVPQVMAALVNTPLRVQLTQYTVQRVRGVVSNRSTIKPNAGSTRDDDSNLVELVVYGVCTLYERVPDKSEKPK